MMLRSAPWIGAALRAHCIVSCLSDTLVVHHGLLTSKVGGYEEKYRGAGFHAKQGCHCWCDRRSVI
eukprot:364754-Chlamydomonas_euryale.AAC.2